MRGDIISIYKYRTGDPTIEIKLFCGSEFNKTHDHSIKLEEKRFNLKLRRGFFTVRAASM